MKPRRSRLFVGIFVTVVGGTVLASMLGWCQSHPAVRIDTTRRPVERIAPKTRVDDTAPEGWSHLVFKARNKLAEGDVDAIPVFGRAASEYLFTVMAARVVPADDQGSPPWRLDAIGIGVGATVGDVDRILAKETPEELGISPGILKTAILGRALAHLGKIEQVAASSTMAVVDAPTYLLVEGEHRPVVLRYLFLVRPEDGGLASLVWRIDVDARGAYGEARGPAVLVRPNLIRTTPLHVDGSKVTLGMPAADAIAATRLPPGREIPLPEEAASVAAAGNLTEAAAAALESLFRQALRANGARGN